MDIFVKLKCDEDLFPVFGKPAQRTPRRIRFQDETYALRPVAEIFFSVQKHSAVAVTYILLRI